MQVLPGCWENEGVRGEDGEGHMAMVEDEADARLRDEVLEAGDTVQLAITV